MIAQNKVFGTPESSSGCPAPNAGGTVADAVQGGTPAPPARGGSLYAVGGVQPPISNKGGNIPLGSSGELAEIEVSIDWFTYTVAYAVGEQFGFDAVLPPPLTIDMDNQLSNIKGYNTCFPAVAMLDGQRVVCGRVAWHTSHREHKICVQMGGQDLDNLELVGVNHRMLLAHACGMEANITRCDGALDIFGGGNPMDLYNTFLRDELGGNVRKCAPFQETERLNQKDEWGNDVLDADGKPLHKMKTASTVYIGSSKSNRFMRVYDKAAELGLEGETRTRVEMICKGPYAMVFANAVLETNLPDTLRTALRDFIQPKGVEWWDYATASAAVTIAKVGRKITNTARWIKKAVAPTFQRLAASASKDRAVVEKVIFDTIAALPLKAQYAFAVSVRDAYKEAWAADDKERRRVLGTHGRVFAPSGV